MAALTKKQQQEIAALVAAAVASATAPAKQDKPKQKQDKPRTIKNPDARASVKQVYLLCSRLHESVFGSPLPNPLTMGDVQNALDSLS